MGKSWNRSWNEAPQGGASARHGVGADSRPRYLASRFAVPIVCAAFGCNQGGQSGTDGLEVMQTPTSQPDGGGAAPTNDPGDAGGANPMGPGSSPAAPPGEGANLPSPWLAFCGGGCADGLSCVCGVCTRACDEEAECLQFGKRALCSDLQPVDPQSCRTALATNVCELHCGEDADCAVLSADHVCDRGRCRAAATGWSVGLCEAAPEAAAPSCEFDERLRPVADCGELECVQQSQCDQPPPGVGLDCRVQSLVQFNNQLGRCEYVERCPWAGSFETMQECWQSCEQSAGAMCLEDWRPLVGADISEVNGMTASSVRAALERQFSAQIRYLEGEPSTITMELSEVRVYDVLREPNPGFALDIDASCFGTVMAEARARLTTADGRFDETWQRLQLEVVDDSKFTFRVQVVVPEDGGNPLGTVLIEGDYEPAPDPEHCLLGTAITGTIEGDAFSGEVYHTRSTRPCGDPLGGVTSSSAGNPTNGPVWSPVR